MASKAWPVQAVLMWRCGREPYLEVRCETCRLFHYGFGCTACRETVLAVRLIVQMDEFHWRRLVATKQPVRMGQLAEFVRCQGLHVVVE